MHSKRYSILAFLLQTRFTFNHVAVCILSFSRGRIRFHLFENGCLGLAEADQKPVINLARKERAIFNTPQTAQNTNRLINKVARSLIAALIASKVIIME